MSVQTLGIVKSQISAALIAGTVFDVGSELAGMTDVVAVTRDFGVDDRDALGDLDK